MPGSFTVQWYRSFGGSQQFQPIPSANEPTYILNADDIGSIVKVEAIHDESSVMISAEAGPIGLSRKSAEKVEELLKKSEVEFPVSYDCSGDDVMVGG